jgi:sensor histidine kinase YesM
MAGQFKRKFSERVSLAKSRQQQAIENENREEVVFTQHSHLNKKPLPMKRTLLLITMVGYMALLVLLLATCWYLMTEYQQTKRLHEQSILHDYIANTQEAMGMIDRQIYDVYAFNPHFDALSKVLSEVDNYQNAYYLRDVMHNKMFLEEDLHGYYIFYDRLSKVWYGTKNTIINMEDSSLLKEQIWQQISVEGAAHSWRVMTGGGSVYLATSGRRDNVAVAAVHDMNRIEEQLQAELRETLNVVLIDNGHVIAGIDLEKRLRLREKTAGRLNLFSDRMDGHYVYAERLPKTDLWVFMVMEYNLWSMMNGQQLALLVITFASLVAVILLYLFLRREFISPLRQLTAVMNEIQTGESREIPLIPARFQELRDFNRTLANMVQEIEAQKLLVYEKIIEKQHSQLQYLQLQLKPHFYLNSLKMLSALVLGKETDKMQSLIYSLSSHLRYLLQSEREMVPLSKEIDFVKNYVDMQQHVTGRTARCGFDIAEAAKNWLVPTLCIQTFVENSVKHAKLGSSDATLQLSVQAGVLSVDGHRFLDIIVSDSGHGYPEDIMAQLNTAAGIGEMHIGINNIKRRCALLYGDSAEYRFYNEDGAVSELIVPEHPRATS